MHHPAVGTSTTVMMLRKPFAHRPHGRAYPLPHVLGRVSLNPNTSRDSLTQRFRHERGSRQISKNGGISRAGSVSFSRLAVMCLSKAGGGASETERDLGPEEARKSILYWTPSAGTPCTPCVAPSGVRAANGDEGGVLEHSLCVRCLPPSHDSTASG
ncbi:hypothetical protein ARUE_232p00030 (plasmid) [Arthrobacter sp. Rue61a]|nr:hypothetical protein ARUE_232p00030 [Arthrobacter sp. Rue61a]